MEDIPALSRHLAQKIAARLNRPPLHITDDFLLKVQSYTWPGNIRELENVIERAIIRLGEGTLVTADLLDSQVPEASRSDVKATEIKSLRQIEKEMIAEALTFFQGNVQKTSAKLGVGRNTLYRKMKEYGISIAHSTSSSE